MSATKTCTLCHHSSLTQLFQRNGRSLERCPECGLIMEGNPPEIEESRAFYEKNYYESFGKLNESIRSARKAVYQKQLEAMAPFRRSGRLLDIGCGFGDFLEAAAEAGWHGTGIEPSEAAAENCRRSGLQVFNGSMESAEFPSGYFDVITLWNVIDYIADPVMMMKKLSGWLAPGGAVLIRTPNSLFQFAAYRFYSHFKPQLEKIGWNKDPSVFLRSNFEPRTLRRLLKESGFAGFKIFNAPVTQGDPYQVFTDSAAMIVIKRSLSVAGDFCAFITGGKVLIGSSLLVIASRQALLPSTRLSRVARRIQIKRLYLYAAACLGYALGLPLWRKLLGKERDVRILLYHSTSRYSFAGLAVKTNDFERQLDFLKKHYNILSLGEAVDALRGRKIPDRPSTVITFDDGYEDNFHFAFPKLRERGLTATFFLITKDLGAEFRRTDHLKSELGRDVEVNLLSGSQIQQMAEGGMTFGSHGEDHSRLSAMSAQSLSLEIEGSREKISRLSGLPVHFFSYPYGKYDDFGAVVKERVQKAGYEAAVSAMAGSNPPGADLFSLKRIGIESSDTLFTFRAKLNGALDYLVWLEPWLRGWIRMLDRLFFKKEAISPPLFLVSVDFPPHKDGVSTISGEIAKRLVRRGHKLLVLGPRADGDDAWDRQYGVRAFRVPGYSWGYARFFPYLLAAPYLIGSRHIHKIFAMNIAYGGLLAWLFSYFRPVDYVLFAYGYEFEKVNRISLLKRLYLLMYARARRIICCSQEVRNRLVRFGAAADKIEVLYPAVDTSRYFPTEVPKSFLAQRGLAGRKIILSVGRLIERKGQDQVLRALPEIVRKFSGAVYCIAGMGPYKESLRRQALVLGMSEHVKFLGRISDEELNLFYNSCEVFVMPSREIPEEGHVEGFGIVYLEANACGKPVIGGRSGAVGEAIQDGRTGLLVDPESPAELAAKIIHLLSHPEEARRLGRNGLERVRRDFSWERYTTHVYQKLCGEGPR